MDFVFVVLLSNKCHHCNQLLGNWNAIVDAVLKQSPGIRFPIGSGQFKDYKYAPIMVSDHHLNSNLYPKDLLRFYRLWTPITLLIPAKEWTRCTQKLGPNNQEKLEGVQIMNSAIVGDRVIPTMKWDTRNPLNFGLWLKDSLREPVVQEAPKEVKKSKLVCTDLLNLISI